MALLHLGTRAGDPALRVSMSQIPSLVAHEKGTEMFGRRKKQQQTQGLEDLVVQQVVESASEITFPGDVIAPDDARRAAQMLGMQVLQNAMRGGASAQDCSALMAAYSQAGERAAQLFAPGGPMHGATSPGID